MTDNLKRDYIKQLSQTKKNTAIDANGNKNGLKYFPGQNRLMGTERSISDFEFLGFFHSIYI